MKTHINQGNNGLNLLPKSKPQSNKTKHPNRISFPSRLLVNSNKETTKENRYLTKIYHKGSKPKMDKEMKKNKAAESQTRLEGNKRTVHLTKWDN